jgi:2-C-methyl-D-erythritol 4-phosphate cytidylyltransferase
MNAAVIVGAGMGLRMGSKVEKLFLEVAGRPVVAHTWLRFDAAPCIDEVVLVVRDGQEAEYERLAKTLALTKRHRLARGGPRRQDSVWNGLAALGDGCEVVAIQDAARPCTPIDLIAATIEAAVDVGAAVAAQRVTDTIKESDSRTLVLRTIDRSRLWAVQTPQSFRVEVIRRALAEVRRRQLVVTDDAAACELIGQPVRLVESATPNPKVTVLADLAYVELLLRWPGTAGLRANDEKQGRGSTQPRPD